MTIWKSGTRKVEELEDKKEVVLRRATKKSYEKSKILVGRRMRIFFQNFLCVLRFTQLTNLLFGETNF